MSALAHYLEEAGIASVAIALIRPQAEHTRPPRALWVPFELGRPLGPPGDAAFQRRVILAALGLLNAERQASLIADFPGDDPREADDPAWHAPAASPHPSPPPQAGEGARSPPPDNPPPPQAGEGRGGGAALADALLAELRGLAPSYARSCTARGRSTVGLSGLAPAAAGDYMAAWLRATAGGPIPASPVADMSPALALRFASDDLKAYALEAGLTPGTHPSSRQLGDWLWRDTALGAALHTLRRHLLAGDDERAKAVAAFFVPALRVPPGG